MRPVTNARKPSRGARTKSQHREVRKPVRGGAANKPASRSSIDRRTEPHDGVFARMGGWLKRKLTIRRPVLYMVGALLGLVFVAALFAGGYVRAAVNRVDAAASAVSSYAGFGIAKLHLSGENRTPPQSVLAALNFKPGQSIFDADLQIARARLMRLPWVADATVARRYPDSITVDVIEKHPFALWKTAKGLYVIERSGAVITRATLARFAHLPVFAGGPPKGGDELVEAINDHRAVAARVRIMQRISQRRWNLILDDGVVVKLPETGWRKQLGVLENLIVEKGILERDIREIDLRSKDNFFFMLRGQDKPQPVTREHAA